MAYHDHGAAVSGKVFFKPGQRFQIQMVRRFVKEQEVRLFKQQPYKAEPCQLSA